LYGGKISSNVDVSALFEYHTPILRYDVMIKIRVIPVRKRRREEIFGFFSCASGSRSLAPG
jgi:hypothetical protein